LKTHLKITDTDVYFIITELEPAYQEAAFHLGFRLMKYGLARRYAPGSPHVERIYENFARHTETIILQAAGVQAVPWDETLLAFLQLLEGHQLDWYLVGSAALAVRGLDVHPGDVDFVMAADDALVVGNLALDYLIQPIENTNGWICKWFARAFMGARVEWLGGVKVDVDTPNVSDFGPIAMSRSETICWRGYSLRVPPLDLQLAANERRGRHNRAAMIRAALHIL
jgi:hypothetical protein